MYRTFVTTKGRRDSRLIYDWLAERFAAGAEAWSAALARALMGLRRNPERHGLAPEADDADVEVRQFLFKTRRGRVYRGLFVVDGGEVKVLHIRGPGQRPLRPDELSAVTPVKNPPPRRSDLSCRSDTSAPHHSGAAALSSGNAC